MSAGKRVASAQQGQMKKSKKRHVWGYWVVIILLLALCAGLVVQTVGTVHVTLWERQQYVSALAQRCSAVEDCTAAIIDGDADAASQLDGALAELEAMTDGNYCLWFNVLNQYHSFTEDAEPCADSIEAIRDRYAVIADGIAAGGELTEKGQRFLQGLGAACGDFCDAVGYSADSASVSESFADPDTFTAPRSALEQTLAGLAG